MGIDLLQIVQIHVFVSGMTSECPCHKDAIGGGDGDEKWKQNDLKR